MFRLQPKITRYLFGYQKNLFSTSPAKLHHLYYEATDPNAKFNLIVLHGLFGSGLNFRSIVKTPKVLNYANAYLLTLRNHGDSEHKDTMTDVEMADDVYNFIKENNLDSKKVLIMGHSLGARVAMVFATRYNKLPAGVVVVDFAPYNYFKDPRFSVIRKTKEMLDKLKTLKLSKDWAELKKQLTSVSHSADVTGLLLMNIGPDGSGGYKWKTNIKALADGYLNITASEWNEAANKYDGPVAIICGRDSDYVTMDLVENYHKVFSNFIESRDIIFVPEAGHWVHFQKPVEFVEHLSLFLQDMNKRV